MRFRLVLFSLALLAISNINGIAQSQPDSAQIIKMRIEADDAIVAELRKDGLRQEMLRAVVWAENNSLTKDEVKDFGALVNQGIVDIERLLGVEFDRKLFQSDKIEYFISSKAGLSHGYFGTKPFIFETPARVRNKTSPYIHETTHKFWALPGNWWLLEGFASHVQTYIGRYYGGLYPNPFNPENKPVHQAAKEILATGAGQTVLALIGVNGEPQSFRGEQAKLAAQIFQDRRVMAPAFYNLTESFVTLFNRTGRIA